MFQETEGHPIKSFTGQVSLQIVEVFDRCPVGKRRAGVELGAALRSARCIELLEGKSPGVDARMAIGASGLIAMLLQLFPQSQVGVL